MKIFTKFQSLYIRLFSKNRKSIAAPMQDSYDLTELFVDDNQSTIPYYDALLKDLSLNK